MKLTTQGVHSSADISGTNQPLPGKYHTVVIDVDESFAKYQSVVVDFQVLAGNTPNQAGRTFKEFFNLPDPSKSEGAQKFNRDRLTRLALATGLIKLNEVKEINFRDAIGRHLKLSYQDNTYEGKTRRQIDKCEMWAMDDPTGPTIPIDDVAYTGPKPQNGAAAPAQAQTAAAAPAGNGGWGNV